MNDQDIMLTLCLLIIMIIHIIKLLQCWFCSRNLWSFGINSRTTNCWSGWVIVSSSILYKSYCLLRFADTFGTWQPDIGLHLYSYLPRQCVHILRVSCIVCKQYSIWQCVSCNSENCQICEIYTWRQNGNVWTWNKCSLKDLIIMADI